jgi:hypothetical protein
MVDYQNATTNFDHPDTTRKLQASGAFIILNGGPHNPSGLLVDPTGEHYLTGNFYWLKKMCDTYRIKFTKIGTWQRLTQDPPPRALFQTEFGARTLADAFEMRALAALLPRDADGPVQPLFDNYSNAEDTFIEQNGFGSGLD